MMKFLSFLLFALTIGSSTAHHAQQSPKAGDLVLTTHRMEFEGQQIDYELGRLMVKENRQKPDSRLIEISFARMKSTAARPGDPVVYLDGGPGSAASNVARIPEYMRAFLKLREVGDVILLDQRGVGRSKPNLTMLARELLPRDVFTTKEAALRAFRERAAAAVAHFRAQGVDISGYTTAESAHDVEDLRRAINAARLNLVGFSYGTHLGLAVIRYHGAALHRVALIGAEGPNHTQKLPATSDRSLERLSKLVAADPQISPQMPDLLATLRRILARLDKEPALVAITDQRTKQKIEIPVGKFGFQFILKMDLGDASDLPIFPALLATTDRGDYSILSRFVERRYNQFGGGLSVMTLVMDAASGMTRDRAARITREARGALLGDAMNFPFPEINDVAGNPDLGDAFRGPVRTQVPTLFFSGTLDNNTPPEQADEVRRTFKTSTHVVIENAGHESMLTDPRVQQAIVDYLRGGDVSAVKIALPALEFRPIPAAKE